MRAHERIVVANNVGATPADFSIMGGVYVLDTIATGSGSLTLARKGPDDSTYITAATAITATSGNSGAIALPPGVYRLVIATFTAVYATLTRIPGD